MKYLSKVSCNLLAVHQTFLICCWIIWMFYFMFFIVVTKEQMAVLMISRILRYSILFEHNNSSTWLTNQPICGEQKTTPPTSCKRVYNVIILFCFEWENIGSELENYIINNKTASWSIMCQKHCGLPSKFLLQPQSMILTYPYLKSLRKSKGRLAECHIIIILGKSIASASP